MTHLDRFERVVRRSGEFSDEATVRLDQLHPFQMRSVHSKLPPKVRKLFDDGHYAEATFEAFKFIDKKVANISGIKDSGYKLMMSALAESGPIKLNSLSSESEKDEQKGYQFMFAGAMSAVRNPRGHEFDMFDPSETCLDHLSLASLFIRKIEESGFNI
jgi:uncharacterized protein (TIGR02391 family)